MEETVRLPESWQGWEIEEEIGAGSYGSVYQARFVGMPESVDAAKNAPGTDSDRYARSSEEVETDCLAAVKIITLPADEAELAAISKEYPVRADLEKYYTDLVNDLLAEIRAMELLKDNPNVVNLQDYVVEHEENTLQWRLYIRMELLTPLQDYRVMHRMEEEDAIRLGIDLCNALEDCRKRDIIHRDIKPENVMVSDDGVFKLGDFGIAKQMDHTTGTMSLKGTFAYMAPEVYHGEKYDFRVDQYSLGIILYRLLNHNREPFLDPDVPMIYYQDRKEALRKRMEGEALPSPADASEGVSRVIRKAASYRPENRYDTISDLKAELEKCLQGEEVTVSDLVEKSEQEQAEQRLRRKKRKNRILLLVIVAAAAALAAAVVLQISQSPNEILIENAKSNEAEINEDGVRVDDNFTELTSFAAAVAYQDEINDVSRHPEAAEALQWLTDNAGTTGLQSRGVLGNKPANGDSYENTETFLVYLDEDYCVGQVLYYTSVIDPSTEREWVQSDSALYYLERGTYSVWKLCSADRAEEAQSRMMEKYLPEGCIAAAAEGRNCRIYNNSFWTGTGAVFEGSVNLDTAAAWQNEDGSLDLYMICRNGTKDVQSEYSYWVKLEDDILDAVLMARGKPGEVSVDAGDANGYLVHFEPDTVMTGAANWSENLWEYTTGKNSNDNL